MYCKMTFVYQLGADWIKETQYFLSEYEARQWARYETTANVPIRIIKCEEINELPEGIKE